MHLYLIQIHAFVFEVSSYEFAVNFNSSIEGQVELEPESIITDISSLLVPAGKNLQMQVNTSKLTTIGLHNPYYIDYVTKNLTKNRIIFSWYCLELSLLQSLLFPEVKAFIDLQNPDI